MTRYVCYICKYLMTERSHIITIAPKKDSRRVDVGPVLNFSCKNNVCNAKRNTVIGKLPPYLYRLRKAR